MATLKPEHKIFIVQRLACFDTPSQCIEAVKEEFGLTLPAQQIQAYDPKKYAGRNLSKVFKKLFEDTRKAFIDDATKIPIAQKAYRLQELHRAQLKATRAGNSVLMAQLLEQAAKEMGEAYTNRQKIDHTSSDGSMTPKITETMTPEDAAAAYASTINPG